MPNWSAQNIDPGAEKFGDSDVIPFTLGSDAAVQGDALGISGASGDLVLAETAGHVTGILSTDVETKGLGTGDEVALHVQGVTLANVAAGVAAGAFLEQGATGQGGTLIAAAGETNVQALTGEANGLAYVLLR